MGTLSLILAVIGGLLIGFSIGRKSVRFDGLFIVDDSENETTRWILDVKIDPQTIPSKKSIHLKVKMMDQNNEE